MSWTAAAALAIMGPRPSSIRSEFIRRKGLHDTSGFREPCQTTLKFGSGTWEIAVISPMLKRSLEA